MTYVKFNLGKMFTALAVVMSTLITPAFAGSDVEEVEIPEALFTDKAGVDKELELEFGFDNKATEDEYEIGVGGSWVFFDRLQLGVEVPFGIRDPDAGSSQSNIGDVEFGAKFQFLSAAMDGVSLSLAASVAAPTGDRDKEIGGVGGWGVAALAGVLVDTGDSLPDVGVNLQLGFEQQIKLSNEQKEAAETLGVGETLQKEFIWNLAFTVPFFDGRFVPMFEVLGTTTLDAVDSDEEGTIVELSGGFWVSPFEEGEPLGSLAVGVAAKAPVTNKRESDFSALLVFKYEFE